MKLQTALTLPNGRVIKNRMAKSAMSEGMSKNNHDPDQRFDKLYGEWSDGGAGLVITGNVMVDADALGEPGNVVFDAGSDISALKRWAKAGTRRGNELWVQLNHPGKQSPKHISKQPVSSSAVPLQGSLSKSFNPPRELTHEEILKIIGQFAESAAIAKESGFTGVQIHGAHGYLVNQFLTPENNQRTDQWGGSIENNNRFLLEIYQAVRMRVGSDFPIGVKLNSADFQKGGYSLEDSMEIIKALSQAGIDLIEISGGSYENPRMMGSNVKESTKKREAYFMDYAEAVKQVTDIPILLTGGFRSVEAMEQAVLQEKVDLVGMARPFAINPYIPNQIFNGVYHELETPKKKTGVKVIDDNMSMLDLFWYEQQMERIAVGREPKPDYSPWLSLGRTIIKQGRGAFGARRG